MNTLGMPAGPIEALPLIDIEGFISSFCPPGSCMACMGCSSKINENMVTREMRQNDPAIRNTEYRPSDAPIEISARLYQTWEAAYWTGGKLATPTVVTYSFANDFSNFGAGVIAGSPLVQTGKWQSAPEYFREQVREAARHFSEKLGIELIETADPSKAQIKWRMEEFSTDSGLGIPAPPGPLEFSGDVFINMKYINQFNMLNMEKGTEGFTWLLHEWGHAIGMKHLFDNNFVLPRSFDHRGITVMSHTLDPTGKVRTELSDGDIRALSYIYGTAEQQEALPIQWSQLEGGGLRSSGSAGADTIKGIADRDWISGGMGKDVMLGFEGDDTLDGGSGDDVAIGGRGQDALVVRALFADRQSYSYTFEADPNEVESFRGFITTTGFGTDAFAGIERLRFVDGTLELASGIWTSSASFEIAERLLFIVTGVRNDIRAFELATSIETGRASLLDVVAGLPEVSEATGRTSGISDLLMAALGRTYAGLTASAPIEHWVGKIEAGQTSLEEVLADLVQAPPLAGRLGLETVKTTSSAISLAAPAMAGTVYRGTAAPEVLSGQNEADRFLATIGDTVFGNGGHDVVYLPVRASAGSDWSLSFTRSGTTQVDDARGVSGFVDLHGGRISFDGIEELRFLDGSLVLGMDSAAAQLDRMSLGLTGERLTHREAARFVAAVETGSMRMTDVANELVLDPSFSVRFAAPTPSNLGSLVDQTFITLGHAPIFGLHRTNWIELLANFGHSMTGHIAAVGASTIFSKDAWRSHQSDGVWVQRAGGDLVARLLEITTGRSADDSDVAIWLFQAETRQLSPEALSGEIILSAALNFLSEDAFVRMMFANVYGAHPGHDVILKIANALRTGQLARHELVLHLTTDPLWDAVGRARLGGEIASGWSELDATLTSYNGNTLGGSVDADWLAGGNNGDTLAGGIGHDRLDGGRGNDRLLGDVDDDLLAGNAGDDGLDGGDGDDVLSGGAGNDLLLGGAGNDRLLGGSGNDLMTAGAANDVLEGGAGNDRLLGDAGEDLLLGGEGDDTLSGGVGDDTLEGGPGADRLDGGAGDDLLRAGGDAGVHLRGGDGADTLDAWGAAPGALMVGGLGDDAYLVRGAREAILEVPGGGIDVIFALLASGRYVLPPAVEALVLLGGATEGFGNGLANHITGTAGANLLRGFEGADTLEGAGGDDTLIGGSGGDVFVFGPRLGRDVVLDFESGVDRIRLEGGFADPFAAHQALRSTFHGAELLFPDGSAILFQGVTPSTIRWSDILIA